MLGNVQLLRFLAASAVVVYHTNYDPFGLHTEFGAVDLFFCISGFIMASVADRGERSFFRRRLIRIIPLYWLLTFAYFWLTRSVLRGEPEAAAAWPADPLSAARALFLNSHMFLPEELQHLLGSLFFIPSVDASGVNVFPTLEVGWTLNLEMYFYVLFALAIGVSRRWAAVITVGAVLAIWAMANLFAQGTPIQNYGRLDVLSFPLGIGVFYFWKQGIIQSIGAQRVGVVAAVIVLAAYLPTEAILPASPAGWQWMWLPPLLLVASLVLQRSVAPKWFLWGGTISYALYLSHPLVLAVFEGIRSRFVIIDLSKDLRVMLVVCALSVVLAYLLHVLFDRPASAWLKSVLAVESNRNRQQLALGS